MRSAHPPLALCALAYPVLVCLAAGTLWAQSAAAPGPADPRLERMLTWAEARVGTAYVFGGRLTRRLPGLDCLGLVFRAHGRVTARGWRSYSVFPSRMLRARELGPEVGRWAWDGAPPPLPASLRRGDVLVLLLPWEIEDEVLLRTPSTVELRAAHVGFYLGEGRFLHASPFVGRVVIEPLRTFLEEQSILGLIAVRPFGPVSEGR